MGERTLEALALGGACLYGSSNPRMLALASEPVPSACRPKSISIRAEKTNRKRIGYSCSLRPTASLKPDKSERMGARPNLVRLAVCASNQGKRTTSSAVWESLPGAP